MTWLLAIMAGIIAFMYAIYFYKIMKGEAQELEAEMEQAIANWMIMQGARSKPQMWMILFLSVVLEVIYFLLVFVTMENVVIITFTALFALFEFYHLLRVALSFRSFFLNNLMIKDLLDWRLERLSAMLFFTHSILILACILFF